MFPFIVPKYIKRYTFGKLYDWPMTQTPVVWAILAFYLLICHFVFSLRSLSVYFRPDYFKFLRQYFAKLNDSISESRYYTTIDS